MDGGGRGVRQSGTIRRSALHHHLRKFELGGRGGGVGRRAKVSVFCGIEKTLREEGYRKLGVHTCSSCLDAACSTGKWLASGLPFFYFLLMLCNPFRNTQ